MHATTASFLVFASLVVVILAAAGPGASAQGADGLPWKMSRPLVRVKKELYKRRLRDGAAAWVSARYVGPNLEREEVHAFEGASDSWHDVGRRFSADNGRTWTEFEPRPNTTKRVAGVEVREHPGCTTYDPKAGVLLGAWLRQLPVGGLWHNFTYYRLSWDFGRTWTAPKQLRYEAGEDFDPAAPRKPEFLQRNHAYFGTSILQHSNGTLILPVAHANAAGDPNNDKRAWRMGSLCFIAKWDAAAKDYHWTAGQRVEISPELSSRGLMEPDLIELKDGRVLVVWRGSNTAKTPGRKWFSLSNDACRTLSQPQEWRYSDGSRFYSPSSIHRFIRHTVTGKVYWFGNICPSPPRGNSPRHPLLMAEVDESKAALKKDTLTVIDDRAPDQPGGIQFSNFSLLENRETHALELYITPIGCDPKDWRNADCYKYVLTLR